MKIDEKIVNNISKIKVKRIKCYNNSLIAIIPFQYFQLVNINKQDYSGKINGRNKL